MGKWTRCRLARVPSAAVQYAIAKAFASARPLIRAGVLGLLASHLAQAQEAQRCATPVAKVSAIQGNVQTRPLGAADWSMAVPGESLCPGDLVRSAPRSRSILRLANETNVAMDQRTVLRIQGLDEKAGNWVMELNEGVIHVITRTPKPFKINAPFMNASVEGTEFSVSSRADQGFVAVVEGVVDVSNREGALKVGHGGVAIVTPSRAPLLELKIKPEDAVQWAIYYPHVLDPELLGGHFDSEAQGAAVHEYHRGDYGMAVERLDSEIAANNPAALLLQAAILLQVGRVDEAQQSIDSALVLDSKASLAYGLRAIIAVAKNHLADAVTFAEQAVALERTPSNLVAQSYVKQAQFDIAGAMALANEAAERAQGSALAWARVAELGLTMGRTRAAQEAVDKAIRLDPTLSRAQAILGFIRLQALDRAGAEVRFRHAVDLDQADPLPHLGLSLVQHRAGAVASAREEMELAVTLDPANALLRSYLGNAYGAENRGADAGTQFGLAQDLDNKDPTPFYFDALRLQRENRPVEALHSAEQAIERNDNRAVFRSRQLLDQDSASRSVTAARIYRELGADNLAISSSVSALDRDPANYSAHLFLAEIFGNRPGYEIARDSELLQGLLLQPANVTPITPRLASNGQGDVYAGTVLPFGLNEYSTLAWTEGVTESVDVLGGSEDTLGLSAALAGNSGKVSYGIGHYNYSTDGFRPNNDDYRRESNAFLQYTLSSASSIQAEVRTASRTYGDQDVLFFGDQKPLLPTLRNQLNVDSVRIGGRHDVSEAWTLLSSYQYQRQRSDSTFDDLPRDALSFVERKRGHFFEARGIFHDEAKTLDVGGEFLAGRDHVEDRNPFGGLTRDTYLGHQSLYGYFTKSYLKGFQATFGLSLDRARNARLDRRQANPKIGLNWQATPGLRVRAAGFRTLKRELFSSRTIEPTSVAGFPQLYDDVHGTDSWRWHGALDGTIDRKWYWGLEGYRHRLTSPGFRLEEIVYQRTVEKSAELYGVWLPTDTIVLKLGTRWQDLQSDGESRGLFRESRIVRVPLEARYFHPRGLFGTGRITWVRQDGEFFDQESFSGFVSGRERFSVVDVGVGYRLPCQRGAIALEVRNALDEHFRFQESRPFDSTIARERLILGRLSLTF